MNFWAHKQPLCTFTLDYCRTRSGKGDTGVPQSTTYMYHCGGKCQGCEFPCQCDLRFGNPFEKESTDQLLLHAKEITCLLSVEAVGNKGRLANENFKHLPRNILLKG